MFLRVLGPLLEGMCFQCGFEQILLDKIMELIVPAEKPTLTRGERL